MNQPWTSTLLDTGYIAFLFYSIKAPSLPPVLSPAAR